MFVVPISFGTWLAVTVVGFGIMGMLLLPIWLLNAAESAARRRQSRPGLEEEPMSRSRGIFEVARPLLIWGIVGIMVINVVTHL